MSKDIILTPKEKEIISLAVSVAAGCQPCTLHHLEAARAAGACGQGTTLAITVGADVRRAAAEAMAAWAFDQHGPIVKLTDDCLAQRELLAGLASLAAAFAVNSVAEFERLANEARLIGATDRQIEVAVGIARSIKSVASQKVEAAAQPFLAEPGAVSATKAASGSCGCGIQELR
jgi:AhpD family alkylhydroperoxidase